MTSGKRGNDRDLDMARQIPRSLRMESGKMC